MAEDIKAMSPPPPFFLSFLYNWYPCRLNKSSLYEESIFVSDNIIAWDFISLFNILNSSNLFWMLFILRQEISISWRWVFRCWRRSGSSKAQVELFDVSEFIWSLSESEKSRNSVPGKWDNKHLVHNQFLTYFRWLYSLGDTSPHLMWVCESHSIHRTAVVIIGCFEFQLTSTFSRHFPDYSCHLPPNFNDGN